MESGARDSVSRNGDSMLPTLEKGPDKSRKGPL